MGRFRNLVLLCFALAAPAPALADPSCFGLCSIDCVKPISTPDRWDDFSVPGSTGWSGNGQWDQEKFTDTNGNGIWDPGEPFIDGSSAWTKIGAGPLNGKYDSENYDPLATGYVAARDLSLEVTLVMGSPTSVGRIAIYPLNIPNPNVLGTDPYRSNWTDCNPTIVTVGDRLVTEFGDVKGPTAQAVRDLTNADPSAYWDDGCQCVVSSMGDASPRLILLAAHDPRIPLSAGGASIKVTKLIGFFVEAVDASGNIKGRFVRLVRSGSNSCTDGGDFVVECAVPTTPMTWGGVKATYR